VLDRLIILGAGGWCPAFGRQTACALLRNGHEAIMIDAGTGVSRLLEHPEYLDGVEKLDIVLTHFHLDHIAGLAYLPALGVCDETTVWGPGSLLYETATDSLLTHISHEPFHPVPLDAQHIVVRDLPADEIVLAGVHVALRRQDRHSAPSLALRFGDELAWITDTAYDPGSISFAEGCQLLAHEAWFTSGHARNPEIHSSAAQAGEVASAAGIDRLLLIHLPPFEQSVAALELEAQGIVPQALSAQDCVDMSVLLAA
jgi:ribonuclease BN (tRNA processing enzyme)